MPTAGQLAQALELTRQMRSCAQAGDWHGLAQHAAERNTLLHADPHAPGAGDPALHAAWQALQTLNGEVLAAVAAARDQAGAQLRQLRHGRDAVRRYQE